MVNKSEVSIINLAARKTLFSMIFSAVVIFVISYMLITYLGSSIFSEFPFLSLFLLFVALTTVLTVLAMQHIRHANSFIRSKVEASDAEIGQAAERISDLKSKLDEQANIDNLTYIANRPGFTDFAQRQWGIARRQYTPLSMLVYDVDDFKLFNDKYGHPTGDEALVAISKVVDQCINRATDLQARIGGEEFAVLLPNCRQHGALKIANDIQNKIAELGIENPDALASKTLTVSIGIATCELCVAKDGFETLWLNADNALLQAKQKGKDQVCLAETLDQAVV